MREIIISSIIINNNNHLIYFIDMNPLYFQLHQKRRHLFFFVKLTQFEAWVLCKKKDWIGRKENNVGLVTVIRRRFKGLKFVVTENL